MQKHYLIPSLTGGDALDIDDAFDVILVYGNEYEALQLLRQQHQKYKKLKA